MSRFKVILLQIDKVHEVHMLDDLPSKEGFQFL
jgi:hypothetical protein